MARARPMLSSLLIVTVCLLVIGGCHRCFAASYRCQASPLAIATNEAIHLELRHPVYRHLHPSQSCLIRLSPAPGAATGVRWMLSVVNASLDAYSAAVAVTDGSSEHRLTSQTEHLDSYQFVTVGANFSVTFSTDDHPEAFSTGLVLLAEPFVVCPPRWLDTGIGCYGQPHKPETKLTQSQSAAACARMGGGLVQGIYRNDHVEQTLASLLQSRDQHPEAYWVGITGSAGNFTYINGYSNPHLVETSTNCSEPRDEPCGCVVHLAGRFLACRCSVRHRFVCAAPRPRGLCWVRDSEPGVTQATPAAASPDNGRGCLGCRVVLGLVVAAVACTVALKFAWARWHPSSGSGGGVGGDGRGREAARASGASGTVGANRMVQGNGRIVDQPYFVC